MKYQDVDPIISAWAKKHGLHIFTKYQDYEVRSTDVVDSSGSRYQIWVEDCGPDSGYVIKAWDYKKRKAQFPASVADFEAKLEEAYDAVSVWVNSEVKKRAPSE